MKMNELNNMKIKRNFPIEQKKEKNEKTNTTYNFSQPRISRSSFLDWTSRQWRAN